MGKKIVRGVSKYLGAVVTQESPISCNFAHIVLLEYIVRTTVDDQRGGTFDPSLPSLPVHDTVSLFLRYNVSGSGRLSLEELKVMMEKLGAPQTHLGLKEMIKVGCVLKLLEDGDKLSINRCSERSYCVNLAT